MCVEIQVQKVSVWLLIMCFFSHVQLTLQNSSVVVFAVSCVFLVANQASDDSTFTCPDLYSLDLIIFSIKKPIFL